MHARVSVGAALLIAGCMQGAPRTDVAELGPPCGDTAAGNACVTLATSATSEVRGQLEDDLDGTLHWGLYRDGDVGRFGPGDSEPVYSGSLEVDLTAEDALEEIVLDDVDARGYQVLAYLDARATGDLGSGDALTLPTAGFHVAADQHTRVEVVLDFVR